MNQQTIRTTIDAIYAQLEGLRSELGESTTDQDVRRLAESFASMDDDHQAKFFVEVARIMTGWDSIKGSHGINGQAYYIGRHLATCECSTEEGRDFVRMIHYAMELKRDPNPSCPICDGTGTRCPSHDTDLDH